VSQNLSMRAPSGKVNGKARDKKGTTIVKHTGT